MGSEAVLTADSDRNSDEAGVEGGRCYAGVVAECLIIIECDMDRDSCRRQ